jgi:4-amino-4-deoxychorismate lyase
VAKVSSWVNGRPGACLSVFDRGLTLGDGLFETLFVRDGTPLLWWRHIERLRDGCRRIAIDFPETQLGDPQDWIPPGATGVLKLIVTAGSGGRGYGRPEPTEPTLLVQWFDDPGVGWEWFETGVRAVLCQIRLSENPLFAGIKSLARLEQVMAQREVRDRGYQEGLLLDQHGRLVEAVSSNLFLWQADPGLMLTPALDRCGIAGTVRAHLLEHLRQRGVAVRVKELDLDDLCKADAVILSNAYRGLCPVSQIGQRRLDLSLVPHDLLRPVHCEVLGLAA